ncbi:MAG: hypothetical protein IPN86_12720 [Saprospiraceae bacterium]|nr:hypothetical protein [Saprospiraceae bacterium]
MESDETCGYDVGATFPIPPTGYDEMIDCDLFRSVRSSSERYLTRKAKASKEEFDDEF